MMPVWQPMRGASGYKTGTYSLLYCVREFPMKLKEKSIINVLFCMPCVFSFIMIIVIPFCFGVYYSMTDWNGVRDTVKFVGFAHFKTIFTAPDFIYSFLITVLYTVINLILVNVVSFTV